MTSGSKIMQPGEASSVGVRDRLKHAIAFVRLHSRIWRACAGLLWQHNVTAMSAALSFRTIFAMVPVLVLAFLVLKSVGVMENSKQVLRSVLQASGFSQIALVQPSETAPASQADAVTPASERVINLADEIERLVERVERKLTVGRLGPIGIVLLIYTATTLLTSMEVSLNRIFGVLRSRSLTRSVPLYWVGHDPRPRARRGGILPGPAHGARSGTHQRSLMVAGLDRRMGSAHHRLPGPVLRALQAAPPTPTSDGGAALGGAIFAVPAWLIAKWLFAVYVREIVATGNLYGALGLVPIFLIWLNVSWLIFLYGAELTYVAGNLASLQSLEKTEPPALGPHDLLAAIMAVARLYEAGRGPVSLDEIKNQVKLPDEPVRWLLGQLVAVGCGLFRRGRRSAGIRTGSPGRQDPYSGGTANRPVERRCRCRSLRRRNPQRGCAVSRRIAIGAGFADRR